MPVMNATLHGRAFVRRVGAPYPTTAVPAVTVARLSTFGRCMGTGPHAYDDWTTARPRASVARSNFSSCQSAPIDHSGGVDLTGVDHFVALDVLVDRVRHHHVASP